MLFSGQGKRRILITENHSDERESVIGVMSCRGGAGYDAGRNEGQKTGTGAEQ